MKRKMYIGSVGPLLYDDEEAIDDQDGDFSGEDRAGIRTDGPMRASEDDDGNPDTLTRKATSDATDNYAKNHGSEHLPNGADPTPTKVVTVVTSVDFVNETVTTEDITVIDDDAT